ncbi:MAG: Uncharacterised protein [SAR116 cluster bacterium]|nr:MAG: Uncharacterised protein [SAR116 cluster bacterium]
MHHIGLFHRGQLAAALARQIHADAANPLNFRRRIGIGVIALARTICLIVDAARFGKIGSAAQLAQDHDIKARHNLGLERRCLDERGKDNGRTQIGKQVHFLAQCQQATLGLQFECQIIILRAADSPEKHRV